MILLQRVIPGCGVTAFNVWSLPYNWWVSYVHAVRVLTEKRPEPASSGKRGHRG